MCPHFRRLRLGIVAHFSKYFTEQNDEQATTACHFVRHLGPAAASLDNFNCRSLGLTIGELTIFLKLLLVDV